MPQSDPDPIFAINGMYVASKSPNKVNLSIGAYRDEDGKPWILPCVKVAEEAMLKENINHEYLPIEGYKPFTTLSAGLILGEDSKVFKEGRYAVVQSVSGTGALRVAMEYFRNYMPGALVYASNPTWGNHFAIAHEAQLKTATYRYWDPKTKGLDLKGMLEDLEKAKSGSIIILHACAHNPTGVDPTLEQVKQIAHVIKSKGHFTFFDSAYQGFASGSLAKDAQAVRYFIEQGMECFIAQSYSKNFGLYGERTGALVAVPKTHQAQLQGQLERLTRALVSNCPKHGSIIVQKVLSSPELTKQWHQDLVLMSGRISRMRAAVKKRLDELKTPGDWSHIVSQIGMFSYTGLTSTSFCIEKRG